MYTIRFGFRINFSSEPVQHILQVTSLSDGNYKLCDSQVIELLSKRAIHEVPLHSPGIVSNFFVILKSSGGFRPIFSLKKLNEFITTEHFKIEGLSMLKEIIRENDWLVKIDLKDAYLTLPMHVDSQPFLQFLWDGKKYQYNCLPFCLNCAPWVFTKILKPIISFLRKQGVRLIIYLDDMLILSESRSNAIVNFRLVIDTLNFAGFLINWEKTISVPSHQIEFLGVIIDSEQLTLSLKQSKVEDIKKLCLSALSKPQCSLKEIATIMGNFSWQ